MTSLRIGLLTSDDWQRYRDIRLASLVDAPYAFGATLAAALAQDEATWRDRAASNVLLASTPTGHDIGIVSLWLHPERFPEALLVQMWVDPAARGAGVGRLLVEAATDRARALGVETLHLHVTQGNERAAGLYRTLGWVESGEPEPLDPDDPARGLVTPMTRTL